MLKNQQHIFPLAGDAWTTISGTFEKAIEKKDIALFNLLNNFLYNRLYQCYEKSIVPLFERLSFQYVISYHVVISKKERSSSFAEIHDTITEQMIRHMQYRIGFPFRLRNEDLPREEKILRNEFSKIMIHRFGDIIHLALRYKDFSKLPFILRQLSDTRGPDYTKVQEYKFELIWAKKDATQTAEAIRELEEKYAIESDTSTRIRHLFKAAYFWCYVLYIEKVYSDDDLKKVMEIFAPYKFYITHSLVEDLLTMREERSESQASWARWDYVREREGAYTPPDPYTWLTRGALLFLLEERGYLGFELSDNVPDPEKLGWLADHMQHLLGGLRESGFSFWSSVLHLNNETEFISGIEKLEREVKQVREFTAGQEEQKIAGLPLNQEYVRNFEGIVFKGWKDSSIVNLLFTRFGNSRPPAENETSKLMQVGHQGEILFDHKRFLVDDNSRHSVFGMERYGEYFAQVEENMFISTVLNTNAKNEKEVFSGLDHAFDELHIGGFQPTVIIIGFDAWYRYMDDQLNEQLETAGKTGKEIPFPSAVGLYRKVPVIRLRSELLGDRIVVADFKPAVERVIQQITDAKDEMFVTRITAIDREKAQELLRTYPRLLHAINDKEKRILRLLTAVSADFYLNEFFEVKEEKAYTVITITK